MVNEQTIRIDFMGKSFYGKTVNDAKASLLDSLIGESRMIISTHQYTVQPGDSLYSIAKKVLGCGEKWPEIAKLNRKSIPDARMIQPGLVILMPKYYHGA